MSKGKFVVITGPTASGKTKISVEIAKEFGSQIISADSMQIYRDMDIGTAKATSEEMDTIPHHFLSIVSPDEEYSVARFQKEAFTIIDKINAEGTLPIVAGGTGLYVNSLVYRLSFDDSSKNNLLRQKYIQLADDKGIEYLYNELRDRDPNYANIIAPTDKLRIVRRLEIIDTVGVQEYDFRRVNDDYDIIIIGLYMQRDILYQRVNERVDEMIESGLLDEVRTVYEKYGYVSSLKAIGYKELVGYINGDYDLNEAIRLIKRNTRRYAKRQLTWFRKDNRIQWFDVLSYPCIENTINDIIKYIKRKGF